MTESAQTGYDLMRVRNRQAGIRLGLILTRKLIMIHPDPTMEAIETTRIIRERISSDSICIGAESAACSISSEDIKSLVLHTAASV